ncbi:hypothetical protein [Bradyrhizobium arachidis]|uniref:hypothetical protein n=1 Tax=Bradyrhizobium arachidis TaxID=858423 RepID=UPI002867EC20|nr:hypothetical protein [Bradyrhizobium arachidis]
MKDREQGYMRVFDAIVGEETVLRELYAPLMARLALAGGTLAKLSFNVTRVVDVDAWAAKGEELFDKRGGPFKGVGSLTREAHDMLAEAWETGASKTIAEAMNAFRTKHSSALLENAPYPHIDDLVQPGPEQIVRSHRPVLLRPHRPRPPGPQRPPDRSQRREHAAKP